MVLEERDGSPRDTHAIPLPRKSAQHLKYAFSQRVCFTMLLRKGLKFLFYVRNPVFLLCVVLSFSLSLSLSLPPFLSLLPRTFSFLRYALSTEGT